MTTPAERLAILSNQAYQNSVFTDYMGIINVKSYGAVGDGVTDDTLAIQRAIDTCIDNGGGIVFFPSATYRIDTGLLINANYVYLQGKNSTLKYYGSNGDAVSFYKSGSYIFGGGIDGITIQRYVEDWDGDASVGLLVKSVQLGEFKDFQIINFTTGLKLDAETEGNSFNKFFIRKLFNNKINLELTASNGGYTNENSFFGGNFSCSSGRAGGYADTINIKIDHYAAAPLNNNKFFGCSLESASVTTKAVYCEGLYNYFYSCRFETSDTVEFTSNSANNVIMYGNNLFRTKITDNGSRNCFYTREGVYFNGGTIADEGAFKFKNSASAAYPAISVIRPTDGVESIKLKGDGSIVALGEVECTRVILKSSTRGIHYSVGSPEGSIASSPGSIAINGLGGAGNTVYMKESGTENTGWIPMLSSLSGSATWDPGALNDGAGETSADITVTGAALGDFVLVSAPYDLQGCIATGYVKATNTVVIRVQNETGAGPIDLASGTWKVKVIKA